jgi:transketolase
MGIDTFGASAKAPELFRLYGLTTDKVLQEILELAS